MIFLFLYFYVKYLEKNDFQKLKMKPRALVLVLLLALFFPAMTNPTPTPISETAITEDKGKDQTFLDILEDAEPGLAKVSIRILTNLTIANQI